MVDTEHLDRVERFAHWLEERRKQAGFTQQELAEKTGISHSYYSKVVHIAHLRRQYGDVSRQVTAPRSITIFEGALVALEDRLGAGCRDEGLEVWSSPSPRKGSIVTTTVTGLVEDRAQLLSDTLAALMLLPPERLKLVRDLIDNLK